jgi:hypothetical protein
MFSGQSAWPRQRASFFELLTLFMVYYEEAGPGGSFPDQRASELENGLGLAHRGHSRCAQFHMVHPGA